MSPSLLQVDAGPHSTLSQTRSWLLFDKGYVTFAKSLNGSRPQSHHQLDEVSDQSSPWRTRNSLQKREVCVEPLHPKSAQVDAITPSFFLLVKESRSLFLSISPVGQVHLVLGFPWISDLLHLILQAALRGDGQAAAAATAF